MSGYELVYQCAQCGLPFKAQQMLQPGSPLEPHPAPQMILQGDGRNHCTRGTVAPQVDRHYPDQLSFCRCAYCALQKQTSSMAHQPNKGAFCPCPACKNQLQAKMAGAFRY